jgi:hypothetical protein
MTTTLPHPLKRIRLQLARSREFPRDRCGYDLVAPLDRNGHIDPELWREHREACRVRRFWQDEDDAVGHLVHRPGGVEHAGWAFEYDHDAAQDDEAGFRLGVHTFSPGEYVSIQDHGGELHTFVVMFVEPVEK